ncbi:MAG: hypothetical protein L6R35_007603, partial [Caloplaca aegaea]
NFEEQQNLEDRRFFQLHLSRRQVQLSILVGKPIGHTIGPSPRESRAQQTRESQGVFLVVLTHMGQWEMDLRVRADLDRHMTQGPRPQQCLVPYPTLRCMGTRTKITVDSEFHFTRMRRSPLQQMDMPRAW